ncbi:WD40 repeat-like protein [Suillus brevipes Sb2]|nr:WD40 repeat-like protein [Suillus brevipes Sb2]
MPAKACKDYRLEGRLIGHKNAINCLTISNNGSLLASGGSDGMRIWDLKRQLQLPSPRKNMGLQNPVDPVTCACWITRQEAVRETLCYGTGLGFIGIWQQQGEGIEDFDAKVSRRIGTGKEIMCITYDHAGDDTRIATGTRDRRVQVWSFDFKGPLIPVFSIELNIFGMYDGEVHALRGTDGVIIATNNAGPLM